jgi:hypothetical protein
MDYAKIIDEYIQYAKKRYYYLFIEVCVTKRKAAQKAEEKIFNKAMQDEKLLTLLVATLKDSNPVVRHSTAAWCLHFGVNNFDATNVLIQIVEDDSCDSPLRFESQLQLSLYKTRDVSYVTRDSWDNLKQLLLTDVTKNTEEPDGKK